MRQSQFNLIGADGFLRRFAKGDIRAFGFTVSVWALVNDLSSEHQVLSQDAISLTYGTFDAAFKTSNSYNANAGGDGSNVMVSPVGLNRWYHLAMVRDASSSQYYLDGVLVFSGTPTGSGSGGFPNPELVIGVNRTENDEFHNGKIDDLKIFDCAFTAAQVDSLFQLEAATNVPSVDGQLDVQVFPNPATDYLHIQAPFAFSELTLYDLSGRIALSNSFDVQENVRTISTSSLSPGIYLLRCVEPQTGSLIDKMIVLH